MPDELSPAAREAWRACHKSILAVADAIERFRFNTAVAQIRELTNLLFALDGKGPGAAWVLRFAWEPAVRLLAPLSPHVATSLRAIQTGSAPGRGRVCYSG